MNRRAFIAALLGAGAASALPQGTIPASAPLPLDVESGPWFRPYSYLFSAELRGPGEYPLKIDIPRDFIVTRLAWNAPDAPVQAQIVDSKVVLAGCLLPGYRDMPLFVPILLEAGTTLTVILRNGPGNIRADVSLALHGRQRGTEEEMRAWMAEDVDAEFIEEEDD